MEKFNFFFTLYSPRNNFDGTIVMDIKAQLLSELSRDNIDYTIQALGNDPVYFKMLVALLFEEPDTLPMRASWVMEGLTEKYPELIIPYKGMLIRNLRRYTHQGTCRNILKILSRMEIDEKYHGILLDVCFDWLKEEGRSVAEKVFAMQIIANHLPLYPDLSNEFYEILEDELPKNTPAFAARVKAVKRQLKSPRDIPPVGYK